MAFRLWCDNCGVDIESGEVGRPDWRPRRHQYCNSCAKRAQEVDEILDREAQGLAMGLHTNLQERRRELMAQLRPSSRFGASVPAPASPGGVPPRQGAGAPNPFVDEDLLIKVPSRHAELED